MRRERGEPRKVPTYRKALAQCRHNGWIVVEVVRIGGGYRLNYVTTGARRRPGTIKARAT